jgi:hypothetical protein
MRQAFYKERAVLRGVSDQAFKRGVRLPAGMRFREQQRFLAFARDLVRLPVPGEGPLDHLLPEARWGDLCARLPDESAWLMALSQATGVYFFPSREWVQTFMRILKLWRVARLLEAGAGRGYLTAALQPLGTAAGIQVRAVDTGDGEFVSGLPVYPGVETGDAFACVQEFQPEVVVYAWPPPGQSLARICQMSFLHYLIVIGEAGGGATGAREDWATLPHRRFAALSRYGRGRTGSRRHQVTVFYGNGHPTRRRNTSLRTISDRRG